MPSPTVCGDGRWMKRRIEADLGLELNRPVSGHAVLAPQARQWLFEQMSRGIWTRQLSRRTEKTYLSWIRRYLTCHGGRDPEGPGRWRSKRSLSLSGSVEAEGEFTEPSPLGGDGYSAAAMAGYPSITVPMGFVSGLPVGLRFSAFPVLRGLSADTASAGLRL